MQEPEFKLKKSRIKLGMHCKMVMIQTIMQCLFYIALMYNICYAYCYPQNIFCKIRYCPILQWGVIGTGLDNRPYPANDLSV